MKRLPGSKELEKQLKAMSEEIIRETRSALVKGAQDIADTAEALVPELEGDLQNTIAVTGPGETTPAYAAGGGSRTANDNQAFVTAGSEDVRYAHIQEFSAVHHPAQPFLLPAYRLNKARVRRRIATAVNKAIKARTKRV